MGIELNIKKAADKSEVLSKQAIAMEIERRKQEETDIAIKERNKNRLDS